MRAQSHVLVVDDEPGILRLLRMELHGHGFSTTISKTPEEALSLTSVQRWPDIAILDLMMPTMSGLQLMRKLRERRPLPTIILTARTSESELIGGLTAGADDYLTKPFSLDELIARVRAVLRRSPANLERRGKFFKQGELVVNLARRLVIRRGETLKLSRTEWAVMEHLVSRQGRPVRYRELLEKVLGANTPDDPQNVRVWISRLRRKVEDDPMHPQVIRTVHRGYTFGHTASG